MALQMDGRTGPCEAGPLGSRSSSSSRVMSSIGTSTRRSKRLGSLASTMVTGRYSGTAAGSSICGVFGDSARPRVQRHARDPPRNRRPLRAAAAWPTIRCAAADGRTGVPDAPAISARCAPRLVGTDQGVDLIHHHRLDGTQRLAGVGGQQQVDRFRRRDQNIGGMPRESGTLGRCWCRPCGSRWPVRGLRRRVCLAEFAIPINGARRFRSTSTASALIGEM